LKTFTNYSIHRNHKHFLPKVYVMINYHSSTWLDLSIINLFQIFEFLKCHCLMSLKFGIWSYIFLNYKNLRKLINLKFQAIYSKNYKNLKELTVLGPRMFFTKLLCSNGHIMSFPHNENFGLKIFLFVYSFIKYRKHGHTIYVWLFHQNSTWQTFEEDWWRSQTCGRCNIYLWIGWTNKQGWCHGKGFHGISKLLFYGWMNITNHLKHPWELIRICAWHYLTNKVN